MEKYSKLDEITYSFGSEVNYKTISTKRFVVFLRVSIIRLSADINHFHMFTFSFVRDHRVFVPLLLYYCYFIIFYIYMNLLLWTNIVSQHFEILKWLNTLTIYFVITSKKIQRYVRNLYSGYFSFSLSF